MHAVAYSLLSYLTAWLKVYYPVEFMTALLTAKSDRTEKLSAIINDCHRMGIKVLPPKINESKFSFVEHPDKKEILFGFGAIKGIGESVVTKLIENQPYTSFNDYLSKIQDKTATIALIKAGAFPVENKMNLMKRYARSLFEFKEYTPVTSLPTKAKLLMEWDINTDDYKVGKKVDKETVLDIYNKKKKDVFDTQQKEKFSKHMRDFKEQYAEDEFLWEFQSLSMFLTDNPLQYAYDAIGIEWDDIQDGDNNAVVPCVIVDIKRKKDKNNDPFAYIDLCINNQIVEATVWSRQMKEYSNLIVKGSCVCIYGKKEDNHLFVSKMKTYQQWLEDTKYLRTRQNN